MIVWAAVSYILSLYVGSLDGTIPSFVMDTLNSLTIGLLSLHTYKTLPVYNTKTRIICLMLLTCLVVYITHLHFIVFTGYYNEDLPYIVGGGFFTFMFMRFLKDNYTTDKYSVNNTFVIYKRPTTYTQFFTTLILKHHSVSIVIQGVEFKFKDGIFIERQHVKKTHVIYKKVADVPICRARLVVGTKWKWYRNCFSIIKEISRVRNSKRSKQTH